jgi:hypothetical protein
MNFWPECTPLKIEESNINNVKIALTKCTSDDTLYCFCKTFPAIDFAAKGFRITFQSTNSGSHSINLKAIRAICNHVRITYGENEKVYLIFVVPEEIVCGLNWKYTQSFYYYVEVEVEGIVRCSKKQTKFDRLTIKVQKELKNLVQYVLCYN